MTGIPVSIDGGHVKRKVGGGKVEAELDEPDYGWVLRADCASAARFLGRCDCRLHHIATALFGRNGAAFGCVCYTHAFMLFLAYLAARQRRFWHVRYLLPAPHCPASNMHAPHPPSAAALDSTFTLCRLLPPLFPAANCPA
jgi:hypothetical protein